MIQSQISYPFVLCFGSIVLEKQLQTCGLRTQLAHNDFINSLLNQSYMQSADQGKIIEWMPKEQTLAHPAVACFLSHSGWNSAIEGLSIGAPFLCWPYFADQFLIRNYICDFWKVGLGLKQEANGNIARHEIKRKFDQLFSGGGIRENGLKIKEMAGKSFIEGGSSTKKLEIFIDQLKYMI